MADKFELPPEVKEGLQPDYREKVQAAVTRAKRLSAATEDVVQVGWRYLWVIGTVREVGWLGADRFEILMVDAWSTDQHESDLSDRAHRCRFQNPRDEFIC